MVALFALFLHAAVAVPQRNLSTTHVVTELGAIEGRVQGDVAEFLGIPFAQPPLDALRFAPPQPPVAWDGVRDATQFKHNCMQGTMNMGWPQPLSTQSEDCVRRYPHLRLYYIIHLGFKNKANVLCACVGVHCSCISTCMPRQLSPPHLSP